MKITDMIEDASLWEQPVDSRDIPEIDLYMDQILTLLEDRGITKTMINNYSKEHLIDPLKGKKYNKEQILQILCILNLKQDMSLWQIGKLMPQGEDIDYRKVYDLCCREDGKLAAATRDFIRQSLSWDVELNENEAELAAAMMLSSCASYFGRLCSQLSGEPDKMTDPDIKKKLDKAKEKKEKKEKKALEKEMK